LYGGAGVGALSLKRALRRSGSPDKANRRSGGNLHRSGQSDGSKARISNLEVRCNFLPFRGSVLISEQMNNVLEITESSFETEVLQAQAPVVVDFYAQWCGPCKMLAPLFEQLAVEFKGRVKCSKANVDDTPELAAAYRITGVPTLALFRGGEPIDALVGLVAPKTLKSWLEGAATTSPLAPVTAPR
jgi:thioredoxin 1